MGGVVIYVYGFCDILMDFGFLFWELWVGFSFNFKFWYMRLLEIDNVCGKLFIGVG